MTRTKNRSESGDGTGRHWTTGRRELLAAGGVVAVSGLAGCLGTLTSSVTNTRASPAAVFAGRRDGGGGGRIARVEPRVSRLTPRVSGGSGLLSSSAELEGWVTSTPLLAANYNNSRSNKSTFRGPDGDEDEDAVDDDAVRGEDYNSPRSNRSIAGPSDIIDDDIDDDDTFRRVSRLDAQLEEATTAATTSISRRSARTGRNPETEKEITEALGDMEAVLAEMRAVLERCSDESCVAALANVVDREADVVRAQEYAQDGEWAAFGLDGGGDGNDIIVGDYLLAPASFDPSGSLDAADRAALFRYLSRDPVVGARFTVCLPDAEVPGGNGSVREAVTPARFVDYVTGRADGGSGAYSWGDIDSNGDGVDDCDDRDESSGPDVLCGVTEHLSAAVGRPAATGGRFEVVRASDGTVVVVSTPPGDGDGDGQSEVCVAVGDDDPCGPGVWARTTQPQSGSGTLVYRVTAQPPECPRPLPALLYVQQCRSDDQLVYTGGWVVDDATLYGTSTTVLSTGDATRVLGIDFGDLDADGDGLTDALERATAGEGVAVPSAGTLEQLAEAEVLSPTAAETADAVVRKRPGRRKRDESGQVTGDEYGFVTNVPVDTPVVHLVNAGRASSEVKFKTGAELSKAVN